MSGDDWQRKLLDDLSELLVELNVTPAQAPAATPAPDAAPTADEARAAAAAEPEEATAEPRSADPRGTADPRETADLRTAADPRTADPRIPLAWPARTTEQAPPAPEPRPAPEPAPPAPWNVTLQLHHDTPTPVPLPPNATLQLHTKPPTKPQPKPRPKPPAPAPAPTPPKPTPPPPPAPPAQAPTRAPAQPPAPLPADWANATLQLRQRLADGVPVFEPVPPPTQLRPRPAGSALQRTGRALRRVIASSAAQDVDRVARIGRDLQQPVATGRQIAVTSVRGGAGKTTVAALLGAAYAHYRHDPVLMLEAEPALGTLPLRLGATDLRWTFDDLARFVSPALRLDQIQEYLVELPDGGWLLPGSRGTVGAHLDLTVFTSVAVALRRYFTVSVVDCESLPSELAHSALAAAQARVLVAPTTADGVATTRVVLEWMGGLSRSLLPGTVVVLATGSPHLGIDLTAAAEFLQLDGVRVVTLPYDRHLAAGGPIRTAALAKRTRECVAELAAEVLNLAVRG
ncbi:MinD/ParA family ATP-binding protein [Kitasatospora sp. LaBMicrA B282]|uniref:MinD/ParA family ATP-binding protein n=1 Tax=Kitasatospora sp. LaBMicrA B282 TaxID=3420949 RepID=UPI003D0BB3FE